MISYRFLHLGEKFGIIYVSQEIATGNLKILLVLSPVGAVVARSLDMGKVTGSNPVLGNFYL